MRIFATYLLLAVLVACCTVSSSGDVSRQADGLFVRTTDVSDAASTGNGRFVLDGRCLTFVSSSSSESWILVFPTGSRMTPNGDLELWDGQSVSFDQEYSLGGGAVAPGSLRASEVEDSECGTNWWGVGGVFDPLPVE